MGEFHDLVYIGILFPMCFCYIIQCANKKQMVGTILTLILIGVSVEKGFFHNEWIIFIDVVSLLAGYLIIDQLELHKKDDD